MYISINVILPYSIYDTIDIQLIIALFYLTRQVDDLRALDKEYIFRRVEFGVLNRQSCKMRFACSRLQMISQQIPVQQLLRLQGYRNLSNIRPDVRRIAEWAADRAAALARPEVLYRRVPIHAIDESQVVLGEGATFHSTRFLPTLGASVHAIIFILTVGAKIDDECRSLADRDNVVEALFIEYAGWIAIERATHDFVRHLLTLQETNRGLTRRLAPGYHDWPLEEQMELFALFGDAENPVELMESCAMLPKKSRSGLYGELPSSAPRLNFGETQPLHIDQFDFIT